MAGGGGGGDGEPEFQIAPMIDVLLVLLIFFMTITSAEVLKVDKKLTLPVSPNAKKRDPEFSKHEMAVNLRWNEAERKADLVIDDKIYEDKQEVVPYLEERKKADEKLRVIIRGDKGLPAIEVQRLMSLLTEAGLSDISFAASNK